MAPAKSPSPAAPTKPFTPMPAKTSTPGLWTLDAVPEEVKLRVARRASK